MEKGGTCMIEKIVFADTIAAAAAALGPDSAFLGGGTEINRLGSSVKATTAVSYKWPVPSIRQDNGYVLLPLGTTFQMVAESHACPAFLKEAALFMGSHQKREMATIAGNLYLHRDDSYITACLLACDAELELDDGSVLSASEYLERFDSLKGRIICSIKVCEDARIVQKRIAVTQESHAAITAAACPEAGFAMVKGTGLVKVDYSEVGCEDCVAKAIEKSHAVFRDDMFGTAEYKKYLCRTVLFDLFKEVR